MEKVARFLGKSLTESELSSLAEHLQFENLSKKETVNYNKWKELGIIDPAGNFMRKGNIKLFRIK